MAIDVDKFVAGGTQLGMLLIEFGSSMVAFLLGFWLMFSSLQRLYKRSAYPHAQYQPDNSWWTILLRAATGGVLMTFAGSINETMQLLFGTGIQDYRTTMSYTPLADIGAKGGVYQKVMELVLLWVFVISMFGFMRGWLLWIKAGDGQGNGQGGDLMWRGFWHILFGAIGMNLPAFVQMFDA